MSSTEATQAFLPVTPEDRQAAAPFANCLRDMQDIFDGKADGLPVVQAFARHRDGEARRCAEIMQRITQSHSLPGDALAGLEWSEDGYSLRTPYDGDVDGDGRHIVVGGETVVIFADSEAGDEYRARFLAAITPSPCPGDVGMPAWRTIDSAPTDGQTILAICASAYTPTAFDTWWQDGWTHYSRPDGKWGGGVGKWFPTHWMPREVYLAALTPSPCPGDVGIALPQRCDGIEQPAFEEWAKAQGFDMTEHPLHYLFLDAKTDAARQAWAAGLKHASDRVAASPTRPSLELVEALELFARLEIPTERVGNAGFYSIPFDRIEKAKAAMARAALTPSALSGDAGEGE